MNTLRLSLLLCFILFSCADAQNKQSNEKQGADTKQEMPKDSDQGTVLKKLSNEDFIAMQEGSAGLQVIDVRTPREVAQGMIPGAVHINIQDTDFLERMEQLDKSKPVVLYCAAGGRSARASKLIDNKGFTAIYDLTGGFSLWVAEGRPVEKE